MRWKAKDKSYRPKDGDSRIVKRFPILPRKYFGYWVWLEWAELYQKYDSNYADSGWKSTALLMPNSKLHKPT